ncbi:MAG: hypothetical protein JSU74_12915 [Candidatus Zixiibacteriota bacterium]|nr:MAG: hypothetical protein JSU74_12915 [candidate division Zixibacteria bacterium]
MPFIMKAIDDTSAYEQFESVLIVPCRFCPAASAAVKNNEPYLQPFLRLFKTKSYERFIANLKTRLEGKGVRTSVFKSSLIHQFVMCMWTSRRRKALRKRSESYDALVVLGCEAAVQSVKDAVKPNRCQVLPGAETEGIMSIRPKLSLSCSLSLELESISRYQYLETQAS